MNLYEIVSSIEKEQLKLSIPKVAVGDLIKVGMLIQEGNKERIQPYEGTVIGKHNAGSNTTITVRKIFQGVGVERIFLIHSPRVASIQVISHAKVRRAKLYYLRERIGKATRLKQKFNKP
jgi:large subunit ribosomal protein L19